MLSRRTGLAGSALLTALRVAAIGMVAPSSVRAECVFIDPWPRITEAAPSAERVVIGRVSDVRTRRRRPNDDPKVVGFTLTVTEEVKGTGSRRLRFGEVVTDTGCITSRLWVHDGDRLAMAFGGRAKGIEGPVSAVAFVGSTPAAEIARAGGRRQMPAMERVTARQVRQASRLPLGPLLLFIADDGDGPAIWRSDGTARGTRVVRRPGPAGPTDPRELTGTLGLAYFTASDRQHGRELWVTDGTAAGTRMVEDIRPGPRGSNPRELTGTDWDRGGVAFTADDGRHGREQWWSNGSVRGTRLADDIDRRRDGRAGSDPTQLTYSEGLLFMSVDDGSHGREIYGIAYHDEVLDVMPGPQGSDPSAIAVARLDLFFAADGPDGEDVLYGALDQSEIHVRIGIGDRIVTGVSTLAEAGNRVWFVAEDPVGSYLGVASPGWTFDWRSKETVTVDAASVVMTAPPASSDPPVEGPYSGLVEFGDRLALAVDDAAMGTELWMSDGTPDGTAPVLDLPGADLDPEDMAAIGDRLWFSADPDDGSGREPWVTDGTAAGTRRMADIAADGGSDPIGFVGFRDGVVFTADDGEHGRELWLSDGTEQGTRLPVDLRLGPEGSEPSDLVVLSP